MPKHTFQDMVRIKKESNKAVIAPKKAVRLEENPFLNKKPAMRPEVRPEPIKQAEVKFMERNLAEERPKRKETNYDDTEMRDVNSGESKHGMWFVALVSIIFLLFAITFLFAQAKITINPTVVPFNSSGEFTAVRGASADDLTFDLVVISGEENKVLEGESSENVSRSAKGIVVVYNAFSGAPQALDIDTRLEASNGKIYKTEKRIVVPGMRDGIPGAVEVGIYGSEPGPAYNSSPLDFKILGFKGGPKYEKFYARSKGAVSGGFVGEMTVVSDDLKISTIAKMKEDLKAKLLKKAIDQIPDGFILFEDAVSLAIDEETVNLTNADNTVPIKIKGTLYGFLFKEVDLTREIVEKAGETEEASEESEVYIPNLKDLVFAITDSNISFKDVRNISFSLLGAGKIVSKIDENMIISETLGRRKKDFEKILANYKNIESANVVIRPFWKNSFPEKVKKIKVEVNYPK